MDNIMVAFEVMYYLKRKKQEKTGMAALETDMSKAYDRVELQFSERMMLKMGFGAVWVEKIMRFVTSAPYHISHEGLTVWTYYTRTGPKTGEPTSPYLFIKCAEAFSCLLKSFERRHLISGCKIILRAPLISHLFFADDALYFFSSQNCRSFIIK